jgi:prepilin-type N-terminal cleavage/methylation domain-containing protein
MRTVLKNQKFKRGVTLVELLISMAVLSTLSAIAIFAATNLTGASKKQKLMGDVATLNSALRVYQASGGDLSGVTDGSGALTRLKSVSNNWKEIAGLRESMIDPRLTVETISGGSDIRAVWDKDYMRFKIAKSGDGVKAFVLSDTIETVAPEDRTANLELAKKDTWVWDYKDHENEGRGTPNLPGGLSPPPPPVDISAALPLSPPEISKVGKAYPLEDFDMEVFLRNPNSTNISTLMVSTEPDKWRIYYGGPIPVSIGTTIKAYAKSTDTENWYDSALITHSYSMIPIPLEIVLNFDKSAYNYAELGGAMIPGVYSPVAALPGTVSLTNAAEIPSKYLTEGSFGIFSTAGAMPEEKVSLDVAYSGTVPLSLAAFGSNSSIQVTAEARSFASELETSKVEIVNVSVDPIELRAPIILEQPRPDGLIVYGQHFLVMDLDSALGDMPEGASIYYTTDGSDPGYQDGLPTSPAARLYEEPFIVTQPQRVPVKACVYPPEGYIQWFLVSSPSQIAWPAPPRIDYSTAITLP